MRLRSLLFWAAAALVVTLLALDLSMRNRLARLQDAAGQLSNRYTALNQARQEAEKQASASRGASLRQNSGPNSSEAAPAAASTPAAPDHRAPVDPKRIIAINPELRAQYLKTLRGGITARWPLLFAALNLPPNESDQLSELMAQRAANSIQRDALAAERGLDPSDLAVRKIFGPLNRQNENAVAALLGPDAYATYQQYSRENGVSPVLIDFAGNLPSSPLTLQQAEQLSHVMAAASQIDQYGFATYGTIDADRVMTGAVGILTPDQLPVLSAVLQKNQAYLQSTKLAGAP